MDFSLGNCIDCLKVSHSLFNNLSKDELAILNKDRTKLFFKKGEILYHEGDEPEGLICLNHGKVKLTKKGKIEDEFILGLQKPVDFVGFDDLIGDRCYTTSAIAIEDVSTCLIKKENLFKVIRGNIDLALMIIKDLSKKMEYSNARLLNISQSQIESRLAFTLKELIDFYGFKDDGKTIAVQLKRKELAAIANMNTANVIRILSKFKAEGIVKIEDKRIIILDKKNLFNTI